MPLDDWTGPKPNFVLAGDELVVGSIIWAVATRMVVAYRKYEASVALVWNMINDYRLSLPHCSETDLAARIKNMVVGDRLRPKIVCLNAADCIVVQQHGESVALAMPRLDITYYITELNRLKG